MEPDGYLSFVVRVWCASAGNLWHGEVEHIQSGRRWSFGSLALVLDFLGRTATTPQLLSTLPAGEEGRGCDKETRR